MSSARERWPLPHKRLAAAEKAHRRVNAVDILWRHQMIVLGAEFRPNSRKILQWVFMQGIAHGLQTD